MYSLTHLKDVVVSQPYGELDPDYALGYHAGIDLQGDYQANGGGYGNWIYAIEAGIVQAGWDDQYGNNVYVDHGGGMQTHYSHMDTYIVKTGDYVAKGQHIGYQGDSGWSTGTHLDFELWENGSRVDPTYAAQYGLGGSDSNNNNTNGNDWFMAKTVGNRKVTKDAWLRSEARWDDSVIIGYDGTSSNGGQKKYPNTPVVKAGSWVLVQFIEGDFAYVVNLADSGLLGWEGYIEKSAIEAV